MSEKIAPGQDHPTSQVATNSIAVGVPMFSRTEALTNFLESLPPYVARVYVADNGEASDRDLYARQWPFELEVINMEYNCGIGPCRAAIAEAVQEPYLFVADNDMELIRPDDLRVLQRILEENPDVGAVSGWLKEGNTIRTGARNLHENGDTLIKNVRDSPEIETNPVPFARFDFIPQAALYRTAIFDSYQYDPEIFNSEHIDFFIGQMDADEWDFASTPVVLIEHNREIDEEYRESKRGSNRVDYDLMEDKWGYTTAVPGPWSDWSSNREPPMKEQAFNVFRKATPPNVWVPVRKALIRMGLQ